MPLLPPRLLNTQEEQIKIAERKISRIGKSMNNVKGQGTDRPPSGANTLKRLTTT